MNSLKNQNIGLNARRIPQSICNHFQTFNVNDCILSEKRIDIWQFSLSHLKINAKNILSHNEQERASRFHFAKHQRRFTIAHATLRLILSRYLENINPNKLEFIENKYGKPELINNGSLRFNLSHSGDLALLAIGQKYPLGVDLEFFSNRPYLEIGKIMFSEKEMKALKLVEPSQIPITFFRIWSQKEAFIKAIGLGLSYPTQKFDVPHLPSFKQLVHDTIDNTNWHMTSFMPTIACNGAICHNTYVDDIRYLILENTIGIT